jgi:hypothetical protein
LNFAPDLLYDVFDELLPQRYLITDLHELLDDRTRIEVLLEHLEVIQAAQWHTFVLLTSSSDWIAKIQSVLNSRRRRWPRNFVVALTVTNTWELREKLTAFGLYRLENKCVFFLPFTSGAWPIARTFPDLEKILKASGLTWLVLGGRVDRQTGKNSLAAVDAGALISAGEGVGCEILFTSESEQIAFQKGGDPTQLLSEIRLDSIADRRTANYFARYRNIPKFRKLPVKDVSEFVRAYNSKVYTFSVGSVES